MITPIAGLVGAAVSGIFAADLLRKSGRDSVPTASGIDQSLDVETHVMHNCITIELEATPMAKLTVTSRGQVTFRKEVLQHLGIRPGDKIDLELLPGRRGILKAAHPSGGIERIFGLLAGRTAKVATIEEMNDAIEKGWAGEK